MTVSFYLSTICYKEVEKWKTGRYEVYGVQHLVGKKNMLAYNTYLLNNRLVFYVKEKIEEDKTILDKLDLKTTDKIINSQVLTPDEKVYLMKKVIEKGDAEQVWSVIMTCDDAYVVWTVLDELPDKMINKEKLFDLLKSKDLSIRRIAIQKMSRCGKDEELAKKLEEFLKTQEDEPTLAYGKETLKVLKGEGGEINACCNERGVVVKKILFNPITPTS